MPRVNLNGFVAVLKDIAGQSQLLHGNFVLIRTLNDINTTNFGQLAFDNLSGLKENDKFPCAIMRPPVKLKPNDQKGWATYKAQIFFLVLNHRNANGATKNEDLETNISLQTYVDDWNDMNIVANDFFNAFTQYCQLPEVQNAIHQKKESSLYEFKAAIGADNVNGVAVSFDVAIWEGDNCSALVDYPNPITVNVTDFSPNTLDKQ